MPSRGGRVLLVLLFAFELGVSALALRRGRPTDFDAYRAAARTLASHRDPYAVEEPRYLYPPLLAAALVPTLRVPARAAAWGFAALSAALLSWSAARLARGGTLVPVLALLFAPFALTQWNLQANAFALAFLVLARDELDGGRELAGGAALGVSIAFKPIALLVAGWLVLSGRLRAFAAAAAVVAASFLLVIPFLGTRGVKPAALGAFRALRPGWVEKYAANVSLNAALDRFAPAGATALRHAAVSAVVLLATLVLVFLGRRASPSSAADCLVAGTLLAASIAWLHHASVLFPALAEGAGAPRSRAAPSARVSPAAWGALGLLAVGAAWHPIDRLVPSGAKWASAAGTLGVVLLWAASGWRVFRTR